MAGLKSLLVLSTLAILAASPVSASFGSHDVGARRAHNHHARSSAAHAHDSFSKKALNRRSDAVRCRARDNSSDNGDNSGDNGNNADASITSVVSSAVPTPTSSSASEQPTGDSGNNGDNGDNNSNSGNTDDSGDRTSILFKALTSKVGIAWPNGDANPLENFKPANGGLYYTWSPTKVSEAIDGFTFAAQLWGWNQVQDFQQLVQSGYANVILGMNEPNDEGQSNMSPESGAQLWQQYIEPLKNQGYYLVSPACTSAPSGIQWIQDWLSACDGNCNPDAIAAHYYDTSADRFKDFVNHYHETFNKDIWITEFACQDFNGGPQCSMDDIWGFMTTTVKWMDQTDWVRYYAWFGIMEDMQNVNPLNRLMDPDGTDVTDLGKWYLGDHQ